MLLTFRFHIYSLSVYARTGPRSQDLPGEFHSRGNPLLPASSRRCRPPGPELRQGQHSHGVLGLLVWYLCCALCISYHTQYSPHSYREGTVTPISQTRSLRLREMKQIAKAAERVIGKSVNLGELVLSLSSCCLIQATRSGSGICQPALSPASSCISSQASGHYITEPEKPTPPAASRKETLDVGKFIRKQWICLGRSHSLVSSLVESLEFYSWLNVDGVWDFSEPLLLKKGPRELSLGNARLSILALLSG